ncbi:transposase [Rhodocytophaga rosea]|uniref:Transposase n=1 Tax=Rhodocytophaga rosea TaxID=2704465 RepID=A0A6C0GSC0_9BACT|nr:transposase [Rhodocytophaga rosea]QHT70988.1 transposase [Rhodocytophaga rosea]
MHELKLIQLYCYICEEYNQFLRWNVQRFSKNNFEGQISDEEILTIYLFCLCYEEKYKIKSMHQHIEKYWHSWFPNLPAYQTFNHRINRLAAAFTYLTQRLTQAFYLPADCLTIVLGDSIPILTCSHKRSGKVATPLTNKAYCATKNMHYYGVKLHTLALKRAHTLPFPCFLAITPASVHDLTALRSVLEKSYAHMSVLDKAYCDKELQQHMLAKGNTLLTPMKEKKGMPLIVKQFDQAYQDLTNTALAKIRQPIESLFSWIQEKTYIQNASKVRSQEGLMVHVFGRLAAALMMLSGL